MMRSFVILHHTGYGQEHWDFLFEEGDALTSWQCEANPAALQPGQSLPCRKLPPHRRAYLKFEGPVSQGRGQVRRIAQGTLAWTVGQDETRILRLQGQTFSGEFVLERSSELGAWRLIRR